VSWQAVKGNALRVFTMGGPAMGVRLRPPAGGGGRRQGGKGAAREKGSVGEGEGELEGKREKERVRGSYSSVKKQQSAADEGRSSAVSLPVRGA